MKRFKFSLETLLKYRINIEKKKKEDWARAKKERVEAEERLERIYQEERERRELLESLMEGEIDLKFFNLTQRYIGQLIRLEKIQSKIVEEKKKIEEEKLKEWIEARKAKKVLENYKEKKWKEYVYELDREEQKIIDDLFVNSKRSHEN